MDWKFKKDIEKQGSSNGFWYDITSGGYINPDKILADDEQFRNLNEAIKIVSSFEIALIDNDLLEEF